MPMTIYRVLLVSDDKFMEVGKWTTRKGSLLRKRFKKVFRRELSITGLYRGERRLKENSKRNLKVNEACPSSVGQAVQHLLYHLPFRDKLEIANQTERELPKLQTSIGSYIQHEFRLDANMRLIESCLPHSASRVINSEDASLIIIKEFWKQLKVIQSQRTWK